MLEAAKPRTSVVPAATTPAPLRRAVLRLAATLAIAAGLLFAPQLSSGASAIPPDCALPRPAPVSFSVQCADGITYHYSYWNTVYYYQTTCYNYGHSTTPLTPVYVQATRCKSGLG